MNLSSEVGKLGAGPPFPCKFRAKAIRFLRSRKEKVERKVAILRKVQRQDYNIFIFNMKIIDEEMKEAELKQFSSITRRLR